MGAGKTTVGRQLSLDLHCPFYDSDAEIVERAGADIPWIFDVEGEEGFRRREMSTIDDLTQQSGIVLATGGGVVLSALNRQHLMSRGIVFYLQVTVEEQLNRTSRDKNRPLLQTGNPEQTLRRLMEQREPLYHQVADHVISTEAGNLRAVVQSILGHLR